MGKTRAEKQIKRLKHRAREAEAANELLEKRVRKLTKKIKAQRLQIADLQGRLDRGPKTNKAKASPVAELDDLGGTGVSAGQRTAWKRHSYLRDRYEFYLNAGSKKEAARSLANEDLKQEYGADCGYTGDELSAILS